MQPESVAPGCAEDRVSTAPPESLSARTTEPVEKAFPMLLVVEKKAACTPPARLPTAPAAMRIRSGRRSDSLRRRIGPALLSRAPDSEELGDQKSERGQHEERELPEAAADMVRHVAELRHVDGDPPDRSL